MIEVIELLELSLKSLYKFDKILLDRSIKEECINHRFAIYLENHFKNNNKIFSVDVEYNRNVTSRELIYSEIFPNDRKVFNKKIILSDIENYKEVIPDIIIHERGSNRNNYLCIEAKKVYNRTTEERDIEKLIGLLNEPFNYKFASLVEYLPNQDYFYVLLFTKESEDILSEGFFVSKKE